MSSKGLTKYLGVLEKHLLNDIPLQHCDMSSREKLRTMIVTEAYHKWLENKQVNVRTLCAKIAARIYGTLHTSAAQDPLVHQLCHDMQIVEGRNRSPNALAKDVVALDHIIGYLVAPSKFIERAKVEDASDWLIANGMKRGDARSVKAGAMIKMTMHKNFDEEQLYHDNLASTDINITDDVSVVKADRTNISDEEKARFAKKFGMNLSEVETLTEQEDGSFS